MRAIERRALLSAVLVSVACLLAFPALADPPVHSTYADQYYDGDMYGPYGPVVCGGVTIQEHSAYKVRETLYYEEGVLTRIKVHINGSSLWTDPATGRQAVGHWGWIEMDQDLSDSTWKYVGNPLKAVVPGVGVVIQDAGLQIYDHGTGTHIKIVGTYQWNLDDFEEFCAALQ
jgi:hypothetical protein